MQVGIQDKNGSSWSHCAPQHKADGKVFLQVHGVDFNETLVPVTKFTTMRCILAIKAALDMEIHQMDVKTTFVNGDLEEDI